MWDIVPDRKTLKPDGDSGIAINKFVKGENYGRLWN